MFQSGRICIVLPKEWYSAVLSDNEYRLVQKRDRNMNGAEFGNIYITYKDGLNASLRAQNVRLVSRSDLCDSRVTADLSISCSFTTIHSSETQLTSPPQLTTDVTTESHAIPRRNGIFHKIRLACRIKNCETCHG